MSQALHSFFELRALPYLLAQIALRRPKVEVEQQEVPVGEARMAVLRPLVVHRPRRSFVFFVHPTTWPQSTPGFFRFVGHWFAERGFTVFLPGYRTSPHHPWPAALEDVRAALSVCLEMRPDLGLDEARLLAGGMGVGAQLAALLVYRDRAELDLDLSEISGFFSLAGTVAPSRCTLSAARRMLDELCGEAEDADPFPFITGDEGFGVLALHGERDVMVDPDCSRALVERTGGVLYTVPSVGHRDLARVFLQARGETRVLEHWLDDVDAG